MHMMQLQWFNCGMSPVVLAYEARPKHCTIHCAGAVLPQPAAL